MDAKLNPVLSSPPDLSTRSEKFDNGRKDVDGPSFGSLLQHAEKKETSQQKPALAPHYEKKSVQNEDSVQEQLPVKKQRVVRDTEGVEKHIPKKNGDQHDDKKGLVAKSYDGMVVSYPVTRIAKDSLDEKTLKLLDDQGLTNLPTFVMAQPSPSFNALQNVAKEGRVIPTLKPIAQFMASLENELGVKPASLVQAFKKLPPGQLALPPEKTMAEVVKNLNLNPKDQAKASELFTKMLAQLKKAQNELLAPMIIPATAGVGVVAAKVTEKTEENGVVTKNKTQSAMARYVQNSGEGSQKVLKSEGEKTPFVLPKGESVAPDGKELSKSVTDNEAPSAIRDQDAYSPKLVVPKEMTQVPESQLKSQSAQVQGLTSPQAQGIAITPVGLSQMKEEKAVNKESKFDSKTEVKNVSSSPVNQTPLSTQVDNTPVKPGGVVQPFEVASGGATAGATAEMKANNDVKHEAIRSIINNAQMLAQKGGGEMHMTLKPEHLGEIQLRVAMEGNRVNVQMTADRGEVKKLIEQNVHELRHGLASHNLSMEKLDVSVSNRDAGAFTKGQPDFGAARDFAQQFHQNQSNRREFMENLSSLRANGKNSVSTVNRVAQGPSVRRGQSRPGRLNVVA